MVSNLAYADFYQMYVTRVDNNVYKSTDSKVVIITNFCLELAISDKAILKYDRYSFDNKIIFSSGTCDVKEVYSY